MIDLLTQHVDAIGYLGTLLSNIIILPQIYKMIKTKRTRDLSIWCNFVGLASTISMGLYAYILWLPPVLLLNSIWFVINIVMITLIIKYKDNI